MILEIIDVFPGVVILHFPVEVIVEFDGGDVQLNQTPEKPIDIRKGFEEISHVLMMVCIVPFPIDAFRISADEELGLLNVKPEYTVYSIAGRDPVDPSRDNSFM
ncbi:MAG: hypothetical protein AABY92_02745 [Thermodesulfobacteriota bacterium]